MNREGNIGMEQSGQSRRFRRLKGFTAGLLSLFLLIPLLLLAVSCERGPAGETTESGDPGGESAPDTTTDPGGKDMPLLEDGFVYRIEDPAWFALAGDEFGAAENAEVVTQATNDDLNQLWRVHGADGGVLLENLSAGLYLTVKADAKTEGALLCLASRNENRSQLWTVTAAEGKENAFFLQNAMTAGFASDKEAERTGQAVQKLEGDEATVWTFKKMAEPGTEFPRVLILSGDYRSATSTPEVRKINGVYYSYNMTGAITIKRSPDLKQWSKVGTLFSSRPAWLKDATGGSDAIWAPGCYLVGDMLRCYYATSSSGSQNSAIGMAYSVNNHPSLGWKDGGMVISSKKGDLYNCIDPNIFVEDDGSTYLIFGSSWTGIYMRKIDPKTGLLDETETTLWHLAQSSEKMEAPYLIKKDGYYYLFLAMGYLNDEAKAKTMPYRWAVGRSESLFGPYVDKNGKPLLEGYTSTLTENKPGIQGVAHAQCFLDDDGVYYLVSESWEDRSVSKTPVVLHISSMVWNDQGWPVTALAKDVLKELAGKK